MGLSLGMDLDGPMPQAASDGDDDLGDDTDDDNAQQEQSVETVNQ